MEGAAATACWQVSARWPQLTMHVGPPLFVLVAVQDEAYSLAAPLASHVTVVATSATNMSSCAEGKGSSVPVEEWGTIMVEPRAANVLS